MPEFKDIFNKQAYGANLGDVARGNLSSYNSPFVTLGHRLRVGQSRALFSSRFAYDVQDPREPLVIKADGTLGDTNIGVFARALTAGTATVYADMNWKEIV